MFVISGHLPPTPPVVPTGMKRTLSLDAADGRQFDTGDQADQGRLARTVAPSTAIFSPGWTRKRDVAQHPVMDVPGFRMIVLKKRR